MASMPPVVAEPRAAWRCFTFICPEFFLRNQMLGVSILFTALLSSNLTGCGDIAFQTGAEQIKASWSEIVNQYQRRANLIPNIATAVNAAKEGEVLLGVINARAKVSSVQATPELVNNPAAFAKLHGAPGELSGALARLLVILENYPQLKSDETFRDLRSHLEVTENRIVVGRNDESGRRGSTT